MIDSLFFVGYLGLLAVHNLNTPFFVFLTKNSTPLGCSRGRVSLMLTLAKIRKPPFLSEKRDIKSPFSSAESSRTRSRTPLKKIKYLF